MNTMRKYIIAALGAVAVAAWSSGDISATESTTPAAATAPSSAISVNAAGRQQLKGHLTPAMMKAPIVGRVPAATPLTLTIGLPVKDMKRLLDAAYQVSDPKSPSYRKYVTPEQFADMFGATPADYQTLLDWARSKNLTVTAHSNRLVATVSGSVAEIETAFDLHLNYGTRPDGTQFFAPDAEPSLDLAVAVEHISGLENFVLPQRAGGSGTGGGYQGTDFRNAYASSTTLTGAGQTIGIFMLNGLAFAQKDIDGYATLTGQSFLSVQAVPAATNTTAGTESTMDIEMALSMAPAAQIVAFTDPKNNGTNILTNMADRTDIKQFSSSWFWYNGTAYDEVLMAQLAMNGQSFFQATGDGGAYAPGTFSKDVNGTLDCRQFPYITLVGGTSLNMSNDGASYGTLETAWPLSSGGYISPNPPPSYQTGILGHNGASWVYQNVPDVSAQAAGSNIYLNGAVVTGDGGGTSQATPLWAGFMALVNQQAAMVGSPSVGFANPALYAIAATSAYSTTFHDVLKGCTPNAFATGYCAGSGYDLATGLGSPQSGLINALAHLPPPPPRPNNALSSTCDSEFFPPGYPFPVGAQPSPDPSLGNYHIATMETISVPWWLAPPGLVVKQLVNGTFVPLANFVGNAGYPEGTNCCEFVIGTQSQGTTTSGAAIGSVQTVEACATSTSGTTCEAPSSVTIASCCVPNACGPYNCSGDPDGCGGVITCPAPTCQSLGFYTCGGVMNICGTPLDCGTCTGGDTCSNGTCCPQGKVGSLGHCCRPGQSWNGDSCFKQPPPHCGGKLPACQ